MNVNYGIANIEYIRVLPELLLIGFGMLIMFIEALMKPGTSRRTLGILAFIGTIAAIAASCYSSDFAGTAFFEMVRVDAFSIFFHVVVIAIAAIAILSSLEYVESNKLQGGEFYGLILFATVGMCLMSSANELVLLFIALEISSIATYVLAGMRLHNAASSESSIKYFLLGSFATAFFLYGVALIFGATGTTNVTAIAQALQKDGASMLSFIAVGLMLVGMGFKIASAPFHIWTPDVYEGAPAPVVGLMSTGPKAAAFALMLRVLFGAALPGWFWLIWVSAALTMTIGNIGALVQNNVKRLLAYSSIAHAGYLLVAFAAAREVGGPALLGPARELGVQAAIFYSAAYAAMNLGSVQAAIFYSAAYAAMNLGAFALVTHLAGNGERYTSIDDYAGLGRRSPLAAMTLTIFLLSLIGIPATAGFLAKFYVFYAALKSNLVWLTILGVINSAIAAYYYLRIIVVMYMREPQEDSDPPAAVPFPISAALIFTSIATLYMGILPERVLNAARAGAQALLR